MTTPPTELLRRAAGALRRTVAPERVVSSGPVFDTACALWNGAVTHRPGMVVRCVRPGDAQSAVRVARDLGLPLSVRGGGHDWAGRALASDGITLDLTGMRQVSVDPEAAVARLGGGATAMDVALAAQRHGLLAVTGTAGAVGMVGLSLGGGYGPLSGRYGLAVDNVLSVELVSADGSLLTVDSDRDPELFWALRGGGGNFGVVTAMTVRLHRAPGLLAGTILYPWPQAPAVCAALEEVVLGDPGELTVQTGVLTAPDGNPVLFLAPAWCGRQEAGERAFAELAALGEPLMSQVGPTGQADLLAGTDALFPPGRHIEVRTRTVPGLTSAVRTALLAAGEARTSPLSAIALHALHGAAADVLDDATAFGNRTPHLVVEAVAMWEPGDENASRHRAWARDVGGALTLESLPGGYPNLLASDETDRIADAYGPNTERLLAAKRHYDPDSVFEAIPFPAHQP